MAEGIETTDENAYLINQTLIKIGKGYLFHKPQLLRALTENTLSHPEAFQLADLQVRGASDMLSEPEPALLAGARKRSARASKKPPVAISRSVA